MNTLYRIGRRIGIVVTTAVLLPACSSGTVAAGPHGPAGSAHVALLIPHPPQVVDRARDEMQLTRDFAAGAERRLDLKVERLWSENGSTWATVSVRNTASFDLVKVTVDCTAFGPDEAALDVGERTLHAPVDGPMGPGAAKTMKILVGSQREDLRSMSCEARAL